jgi:hypothetical protein
MGTVAALKNLLYKTTILFRLSDLKDYVQKGFKINVSYSLDIFR